MANTTVSNVDFSSTTWLLLNMVAPHNHPSTISFDTHDAPCPVPAMKGGNVERIAAVEFHVELLGCITGSSKASAKLSKLCRTVRFWD